MSTFTPAILRLRPWNSRSFPVPVHFHRLPTMMSLEELRALAFFTQHYPLPEGVIVDLGPFVGGSTAALGWGLNQAGRSHKIHSYDLFEASEEQKAQWLYAKGHPKFEGSDTLNFFKGLTKDFNVVAHKGDFRKAALDESIALMFVDIAKAFDTNDRIVREFMPKLQVGAPIIQQDFMFYGNPWVSCTMYKLRQHVEFAGHTDYNTIIFILTSPLGDKAMTSCLQENVTTDDLYASVEWARRLVADYRHQEMIEMMRAAIDKNGTARHTNKFAVQPVPEFDKVIRSYRA